MTNLAKTPEHDLLNLLEKVRIDLAACQALCEQHGLSLRASVEHMISDLRVVAAWVEQDATRRSP